MMGNIKNNQHYFMSFYDSTVLIVEDSIDYKIMSSVFICKNCTEKFPEPEMAFNCIKCGNKFEFIDAKLLNSPTFKWLKESINQNKSLDVENSEILNVVSQTT